MDLSKEINKNIYLFNAFRIFNLPITASQRKVRNEFDNVESVKELGGFGSKESLDVYNNLPFPINPKPNFIDYQNAKNRLNQPRDRFIDELFWFWPEDLNNKRDPTFKALKKADVDGAVSIWQSSSASNAAHNLAVYNHVLAIDNEFGDDGNNKNWREALNQWHITLSNNDFKSLAIARVQQLNDPTIREDYVEEIFGQLSLAILSINASLANDYLKQNDKSNFNRHLGFINNSSFDDITKQESLQGIFDGLYDSINERYETFDNDTFEKESDISKVERFLDDVTDDLGLLKTHFSSNFQYQSLSDNIAKSVKNKLVNIVNNIFEDVDENSISKITSFDFNRIERIFDRIVDMAYGYDVKEDVEQNRNMLKSLTSQLKDKKVHDKINEFIDKMENTGIYSAKSYARDMENDLANVDPNNKDNFSDYFAMSLDAYVVTTINKHTGNLSKIKELKQDLLSLLEIAKRNAVKLESKNKINEDIKTLEEIDKLGGLTDEQIAQLQKVMESQSSSTSSSGSSSGSGGKSIALGCIIWIVIIAVIILGIMFFMGWL